MLGFNPPDCIRIPNPTVKNKIRKALGMKIDETFEVSLDNRTQKL